MISRVRVFVLIIFTSTLVALTIQDESTSENKGRDIFDQNRKNAIEAVYEMDRSREASITVLKEFLHESEMCRRSGEFYDMSSKSCKPCDEEETSHNKFSTLICNDLHTKAEIRQIKDEIYQIKGMVWAVSSGIFLITLTLHFGAFIKNKKYVDRYCRSNDQPDSSK